MTERSSSAAEPDLAQGVPLENVVEGGIVTGHVGGVPALLVCQAGELFAIGATCTHYARHWRTACWPARRSGAPGTMPASACAQACPSDHLPSTA